MAQMISKNWHKDKMQPLTLTKKYPMLWPDDGATENENNSNKENTAKI